MAGKDEPDHVVKEGFMVKRSQNKKRFTPINYKQRWFVLTRQHLTYYDTDSEVSCDRKFIHSFDNSVKVVGKSVEFFSAANGRRGLRRCGSSFPIWPC